jgi:hypothetical protein
MSNRNPTRSTTTKSRPVNSIKNGFIPAETTDGLQAESTIVKEEISSTSVVRKQKQWATDAAGVPHFLCLVSKKNYLLFACDKYGTIDLYQLDGSEPRNTPRHLRQFELFAGNNASQQPQIIEAFTVYTPFIVVSARMFIFDIRLRRIFVFS